MNYPLPSYSVESHSWQYPRQRSKGYKFEPHGPLETGILPSSFNRNELNHKLKLNTRDTKRYVSLVAPSVAPALDLIPELLLESIFVQQHVDAADPLAHHLLAYGKGYDFNNKRSEVTNIIACPSGEVRNRLLLADMENSRMYVGQHSAVYIRAPEMHPGTEVWDFKSPIRSVKFACEDEPAELYTSPRYYLGVRTMKGTHIFRTYTGPEGKHKIRRGCAVELVFECKPNDSGGEEHADLAFNPWDERQVAVLDVVGNWIVFDRSQSGRKVWTLHNGTLPGETVKGAGRMCFGGDGNTLMASNPDRLFFTDLRTNGTTTTMIDVARLPLSSAKIYDIKRWGMPRADAFVLTSKELVWIDARMPGKSVLALEHYRNSHDYGMALQTFRTGSDLSVAIHSHQSPIVATYQFSADYSLPTQLSEPYQLHLPHNSPVLGTKLLPVDLHKSLSGLSRSTREEDEEDADRLLADKSLRFLNVVVLEKDLRVTQQVFSTNKDYAPLRRPRNRKVVLPDLDEIEEVSKEASLAEEKPPQQEYSYNLNEMYAEAFPLSSPSLLTYESSRTNDPQEAYSSALATQISSASHHSTLLEAHPPSNLFPDLTSLQSALPPHILLPTKLPPNPNDTYTALTNAYLTPLPQSVPVTTRLRRERLCRMIAAEAYLGGSTPRPTFEGDTPLARLQRFCRPLLPPDANVTPPPPPTQPQPAIPSTPQPPQPPNPEEPRTARILADWPLGADPAKYTWLAAGPVALDARAAAAPDTVARRRVRDWRRESQMHLDRAAQRQQRREAGLFSSQQQQQSQSQSQSQSQLPQMSQGRSPAVGVASPGYAQFLQGGYSQAFTSQASQSSVTMTPGRVGGSQMERRFGRTSDGFLLKRKRRLGF